MEQENFEFKFVGLVRYSIFSQSLFLCLSNEVSLQTSKLDLFSQKRFFIHNIQLLPAIVSY